MKHIYASDIADFQVDDYLFEIGGKNKTIQQIKKSKLSSWIVKDDILMGSQGIIPFLYFGFCY